LDISVGTCLTSHLFRNTEQPVCVTSLDLSEKMLQQCQSKNIANHLCRADASVNTLPFKSAHFDLVLAGGVLVEIG